MSPGLTCQAGHDAEQVVTPLTHHIPSVPCPCATVGGTRGCHPQGTPLPPPAASSLLCSSPWTQLSPPQHLNPLLSHLLDRIHVLGSRGCPAPWLPDLCHCELGDRDLSSGPAPALGQTPGCCPSAAKAPGSTCSVFPAWLPKHCWQQLLLLLKIQAGKSSQSPPSGDGLPGLNPQQENRPKRRCSALEASRTNPSCIPGLCLLPSDTRGPLVEVTERWQYLEPLSQVAAVAPPCAPPSKRSPELSPLNTKSHIHKSLNAKTKVASSVSQSQQRRARKRKDNYKEAGEGIFIRNRSDRKRGKEFTLREWV